MNKGGAILVSHLQTNPLPEEDRLTPVRTVQDLLASVWRQPWVRLLTYLLLAAAALWFIRRLGSVLMTAAVAYGLAYLSISLLRFEV